ncbi:DUF982 domain-containing protein [Rhizobium sp. CG4]|jgi:hypothetical protein|nr:DUF982 domain-containing protein [Rhizobium sp. CG4]MCM2457583.1 DUF982 domain-containing protein [Rhizobium sp. CG4]
MSAVSWSIPVELRMPHSGMQTVHGPFAALILLMDEWPVRSGPAYVSARSSCRAAIDGREAPEETRERFVLAAREAGLLPSEMRREGKLPFATGGKLHQSINASAESPPVVNRP